MTCKKCGASILHGYSFCASCGAAESYDEGGFAPAPQELSGKKPKQRLSKKWLIVIACIAVVAIGVSVLIITLNRKPEFELLADGTLYCEDPLKGDGTIIIPREYDGKATKLDESYTYYWQCNFEYDGKLRHFLKFYSWLLDNRYRRAGETTYIREGHSFQRYIYCNDYTLVIYGVDGGSYFIDYEYEGGAKLRRYYFEVLDGDRIVKQFEYASELLNWSRGD